MRRLRFIAAFVLLLALVPASAQMRGGGHGSFGGHGGFAGRGSFGGHSIGGRGFGGMTSGRGFSGSHFQSRGFSRGSSFHQPNFFRGDRFRGDRFRGDRFRGDRFGHRRFRNFRFGTCFGCNTWGGWPGWYSGYYDPYWYWDSHSSYDEDRERDLQLAQEMNAQSLEEQRARRQEDQDLYARSDPEPRTRVPEAPEAPGPPTVLVFRDQHKEEVQNYAIVGRTLWNFTPPRTRKIPLADLDLDATAKANEERGVDFRVPGAGEGQ
jgi:hypothetical protein